MVNSELKNTYERLDRPRACRTTVGVRLTAERATSKQEREWRHLPYVSSGAGQIAQSQEHFGPNIPTNVSLLLFYVFFLFYYP